MKNPEIDKYIKKNEAGFEVRVTCELKSQYFERRKRKITTLGEARNVAIQFLAERQEFKDQVKTGILSWETAISDWESGAIAKKFSATTIHSATHTLKKHTQQWFRKSVSVITTEEIERLLHSVYSDDQVELPDFT